jgi:hypothetical protein
MRVLRNILVSSTGSSEHAGLHKRASLHPQGGANSSVTGAARAITFFQLRVVKLGEELENVSNASAQLSAIRPNEGKYWRRPW